MRREPLAGAEHRAEERLHLVKGAHREVRSVPRALVAEQVGDDRPPLRIARHGDEIGGLTEGGGECVGVLNLLIHLAPRPLEAGREDDAARFDVLPGDLADIPSGEALYSRGIPTAATDGIFLEGSHPLSPSHPELRGPSHHHLQFYVAQENVWAACPFSPQLRLARRHAWPGSDTYGSRRWCSIRV
eukprot:gene6248-biopygen3676